MPSSCRGKCMSTTKIAKRSPKAALSAQATGPSVGPTLCIAGIGASAGGFEAIRHFFKAMPADSGVAFVVVQHLDRTHVSLAAELFSKNTSMLVREATDGLRVQANHVYTSPSDKEVAMQDGCLRLTERGSRERLHLPIDHFFSALGLKSIATHGGIVLVQDPETAEFDGMPRSAIAAGVANYVLPVEQMAQVISGYVRRPYVAGEVVGQESGADPKATQSLLKIIHERRGYDFSGYKRGDEPIRIWVPGCSTGEDDYTVAMVVLDRLRITRKTCPLQIFATDTNNDALEVGRSGRYPVGIASRITPARLKRYFVKGPDSQHFIVSDTLRAAVVFGSQNMFSDPPFGRVDLISCRNVLIYLESDLQKRVLNIFHFALRKEGYLLLGSAESNSMRDDLFNPISKKWRIFQRMGSVRADTLALPTRLGDSRPGFQLPPARSAPPLSQVASIAQKLILDRFAPASVLIDSHNETLYFCGPTDDFLMRPRGAPVQDLLLLVREGLRSRLRVALSEAAATDLTVSVTGARMKRAGGFAPVEITVTPHRGTDSGPLFLVVFRHDQQPSLLPPEKSAEGELVRHLEEELQATRDDLQASVECFETSTEDINVSKEELQSLNEELTTVNQQLEAKVRELEDVNTDLNNLLNSSEIATICLDRTLHIKWYTPAAHNLFKFLPADLGRPIGDFALTQAGTGVIEAATAVLANKAVTLAEFESASGRCYMRRTLPYRDEKNNISGIILTYADITESWLAARWAHLAHNDLNESHAHRTKCAPCRPRWSWPKPVSGVCWRKTCMTTWAKCWP